MEFPVTLRAAIEQRAAEIISLAAILGFMISSFLHTKKSH